MQRHTDHSPGDGESTPIRALHVDDDRSFAEMAARFLERADERIAVETATSAEAGLERLSEGSFDCVVSDYDMPGRNGIEFLEAVRDDHPDLPFVLFTGKGSEEIASDAISAGVTDYLQKDTGTDQYAILANRIANVVEGRRSQRALEERKRRLETLISNLPGIVYRCRNEPGWPMEVVEGECEEITGYDAAALEGDDVVWGEDVLHPADRGEMWDDVQAALDDRDAFEVTYRIHTADGETRWMWERGRGVYDGDRVVALEGFMTDITARRARETELERTNAVLSTLFDALPVGVVAEDAAGEVMAANEGLADLIGAEALRDGIVGRDRATLADEVEDAFASPERFRDRVERLIDERSADAGELRMADGRTLEQIHRPIELPDGEGHLWAYRDVTDRVERERELERYETLVETVARGVFAQDADGRYSFVNSHIEEKTGYDRGELVGSYPTQFLPAEDVQRISDGIRDMMRGDRETVEFESTMHTADGGAVPIEGKLALLPSDDGFDGTVGVVRDISERRERERKLDRLRDRTRALSYTETETETARVATEAADDIIGAPLSGVHLVNDAGDAIVPCAAVESVVETFGDPPTYSRDAEPGSRAAIVWDVFESGDPIRVDDTDSFDRLDEESPSGSVLIHPLGDHGVFIVSAPEAGAFDDTDEALVELLATSLRTGLDRVEREATLRRQRDRLRERNERLDQFTSVVSHDLRNPLDVAQGRLALVREEFEDDRGHLAEVAAAHDRMATLIDDVLALARQGESVSDVQPVNLASLAEGCWRSVATESGTMAVSTDRVVYADRTQLQRLLENLFRNAVEHAGEDVTVTVGDLEDGFYVADDGPGIPPEHRESAFETGYSTTDDGTGFGLAIVEGIADAHGWDVRLAEGSDGGARIEVTGLDRERE